jgi:hypothetical protein
MVQHADESNVPIHHIILVGHNSRVFYVPFMAQHLINYKIDEEFFGDNRFRFGLDTMRIAKQAGSRKPSTNGSRPLAYNLRDLHTFVTGKCYENSHQCQSYSYFFLSLLGVKERRYLQSYEMAAGAAWGR